MKQADEYGKHLATIGKMLDTACHAGTSVVERENALTVFHRVTGHLMPSSYVVELSAKNPDGVSALEHMTDRWRDAMTSVQTLTSEVKSLRMQVKNEAKNVSKRAERMGVLEQQVADLTRQLAVASPHSPDFLQYPYTKSVYTREEFLSTAGKKFGKVHGVLKWLCVFSRQCHRDDPAIRIVTDTHVQEWRKKDSYPAFAMELLSRLPNMQSYETPLASKDRKNYLHQLVLDHPEMTMEQLADNCADEWGCYCNDNHVKKAIMQLRDAGQLPRDAVHRRVPRSAYRRQTVDQPSV